MDDIAFLDGTAQAEFVRRKEITPLELVDAAIERIERLNPVINAVITPMYEEARRWPQDACRTDLSPACLMCSRTWFHSTPARA